MSGEYAKYKGFNQAIKENNRGSIVNFLLDYVLIFEEQIFNSSH